MLELGEVLKELREKANMTQAELGYALHVSKSTVSCYEQNTRCPPPEMIIKIANKFHVSADYILGREQKWRGLDINGLNEDDVDFLFTTISFLKAKNHVDDKMPLR